MMHARPLLVLDALSLGQKPESNARNSTWQRSHSSRGGEKFRRGDIIQNHSPVPALGVHVSHNLSGLSLIAIIAIALHLPGQCMAINAPDLYQKLNDEKSFSGQER